MSPKPQVQTWGVQARSPFIGGWRRTVALPATVGLSVASAVLHGWLDLLLIWTAVQTLLTHEAPDDAWLHGALLTLGLLSAWASIALGCWLSGRRFALGDLLSSPVYWAFQSIAALRAVWELFARPFHWDKTPHQPHRPSAAGSGSAGGA